MFQDRISANNLYPAAFSLLILLTLLQSVAAQQAKSSQMTAKQLAAAAQTNDANTPAPTTIIGSGTANMIPIFSGFRTIKNSLITQTGNGISVAGAVSAVGFVGDGSALTNVPAVQLGGLPASAFAQTAASNIFSADQTINGNLNLTGYINSAFSVQGNLTDANGQEGTNIVGGFPGNAAFGGNSIAPGVIGATIGGGGGVYDPSLLPNRPAQRKPAIRTARAALRNPFVGRSPLESKAEESSEAEAQAEQEPPPGLVSGGNSVTNNPINPCCPDGATVAGGLRNTASGFAASVGGGYANTSSGSYSTVSGGDGNSATASETTIAGGTNNTASEANSTVGGGYGNTASGDVFGDASATVAGGQNNIASGGWATVSGGYANTAGLAAGSLEDAVGGGGYNTADGGASTISGGSNNTASGQWATIPGGYLNTAAGFASFAAGFCAVANYDGSFVWAGSGDGCANDTGQSQFVVSALGGFYFYTSYSGASGSGATLPAGSGSWSSLSDRNGKANFLAIDPAALLQKLAAMPVSTWNYKTQDDSVRHMGPMAQDFHAAFGLGEDDKHISTVDAEGVALAGVQALYAEMKRSLAEKDQEISELRARMAQLGRTATTH